MNVVMIGPFGLRLKGTLRVRALPMARALVARGHTVMLLVPPWDSPTDAGQEWEEAGVRVVNVSLPPRLPLLFHAWLALRLVRRALASHPHVIHCFKPKAYAGLAHLMLWWLRRLGLVRQVRLVVDTDDWEQAWNTLGGYSAIKRRFFAWQERWGLTHADAVVVASRALIGLVEKLGVAPARVFYVPNGMVQELVPSTPPAEDRAAIVRMLWELDNAAVVLLYTRFVEFRLERIVEILRRVVAVVPQARLLVVGEGFFGEEAELDEMLMAAGLSQYAVFTGWVEAAQLPGYFAASDVAIFPYDDTPINRAKCSVKLIDLMAAGLPVVADAVGQNNEYIVDGVSGLLAPPEDDVALADGVVHLLQAPELRQRMGTAAARHIREHFTWNSLAVGVEKAYQ